MPSARLVATVAEPGALARCAIARFDFTGVTPDYIYEWMRNEGPSVHPGSGLLGDDHRVARQSFRPVQAQDSGFQRADTDTASTIRPAGVDSAREGFVTEVDAGHRSEVGGV